MNCKKFETINYEGDRKWLKMSVEAIWIVLIDANMKNSRSNCNHLMANWDTVKYSGNTHSFLNFLNWLRTFIVESLILSRQTIGEEEVTDRREIKGKVALHIDWNFQKLENKQWLAYIYTRLMVDNASFMRF